MALHWCDLQARLATLLNSLLALQTVESRRGVRATDERLAWTGSSAGQKKTKWTTLIIIDSQAVKNTCIPLVFPFLRTVPLPMSLMIGDSPLMLSDNIDYFRSKPVNIPKITILLFPRLSSGLFDSGVRANLSTDYDEDQV
jgi:hypothetical protein